MHGALVCDLNKLGARGNDHHASELFDVSSPLKLMMDRLVVPTGQS
jgi:hypothetical protein